ncbi:gluconokinase [Oenococcus kitaharae]|uniref:Gluconokinase n=1 Tax=Oenococcus kitaharae DSM 17330 TaxID=1045004 RepID=G9WHU5_9LACO|nr:gluconokinase [Oenococcus kitaharae]EHN58669.1 Gluconokinase [Oenococcus kitaharae DSM 17330]OEY83242.1 gluconokinase [Oenococcus kitaharae]OEY84235.1 gluconokinase [Oenococcus kitaharae]OEY85858.1 gluconokinase [Oenococcus kitaharae]
MDYIIGMDIGTTSTKAVLYDLEGKALAYSNNLYALYRDTNGMAEEDPDEIFDAVIHGLQEILRKTDFKHGTLRGVSFSSANQSLIALDKDHQPLTRIITWADTRATKYAEELKRNGTGSLLYQHTGTPIHPMSPLCKLLWLKNEHPEIYTKTAYYCGVKEYIFYRLFNVWQIDISVASCTGIFNIFNLDWDNRALELTGVNRNQLPKIVDGYQQTLHMNAEYAKILGYPSDAPFIQGAFDGALSNLGVGAISEGEVAVTIGTSGGVRVVTDHPVIDPKERVFCYALTKKLWVVGGPVNNGGVIFRWARDNLFDAEQNTAALLKIDSYDLLTKIAETVPAGADGLIFLPFLGGERAPIWDADARGTFFGLTQMHTRANMVRAILEGIVYNLYTVLLALEEVVGKPKSIMATGGFTQSPLCRQILADIFETPITIPEDFESSCLGAAVVGMKSLGLVDDLKVVKNFIGKTNTYEPDSNNFKAYRQLVPIYIRLSRQLKSEYQNIADFQRGQA